MEKHANRNLPTRSHAALPGISCPDPRKPPGAGKAVRQGKRAAPGQPQSGTGGTMTKKRRRPIHLHVMVSEEEQALIRERMAEAGIRNMGAYMRKMALNGYVLHVDLSPVREWCRSSGGAQTISIKWQSRPTPTAGSIPRKLSLCNGTMKAVGAIVRSFEKAVCYCGALVLPGSGFAVPRLSLLRDTLSEVLKAGGILVVPPGQRYNDYIGVNRQQK